MLWNSICSVRWSTIFVCFCCLDIVNVMLAKQIGVVLQTKDVPVVLFFLNRSIMYHTRSVGISAVYSNAVMNVWNATKSTQIPTLVSYKIYVKPHELLIITFQDISDYIKFTEFGHYMWTTFPVFIFVVFV